MSVTPSNQVRELRGRLAGALRDHWVLFLTEGILLLVLGVLALLAPMIASLAATVFFGWILLLSGIMGFVTTFHARQAPGFWWSLLSALLGPLILMALRARHTAGSAPV